MDQTFSPGLTAAVFSVPLIAEEPGYSFLKNYPNPFNPATIITYIVPEDGFVHLVEYNVLGRKVTDLVNRAVKAGSHLVNFDAENLSSGVYYYKLETKEYTKTKKMILLR